MKAKIELFFNNLIQDEVCPFTGEHFTPDVIAFRVREGKNKGRCVSDSYAREKGFTMSQKTFDGLLECFQPEEIESDLFT